MKKSLVIIIIAIILVPILAIAASSIFDIYLPFGFALFMEAFVTIHMSLFVLKPLSKMLTTGDDKKLFWKLFWTRIGILLFTDIFITSAIALVDFMGVFIGAFFIVPITAMLTKNTSQTTNSQVINNNTSVVNREVTLKCAKCGGVLETNHKFCTTCGEPFDGNNVTVDLATTAGSTTNQNVITAQTKVPVLPSSFDDIYRLSEDKMVEEFLNRELTKAGIDKNSVLIPEDILKRKKVLNTIFAVLVFIFISLVFFHFPIYTYIIGLVLLFVFYKVTRNYNLMKYLKKQLKARPNEKISNIVMNVKTTSLIDNSKNLFITSMCIAIILPLVIFFEPRILYEKMDNGYGVRFYTFGLTNFTTVTIPESYKGEPVVSLRGNTFSNMFLLEKITLPDSITEIRGQAFKNNRRLTEIELPSNLEYLGGGAFYNCTSLTSIEIPETVTYIGGESFYNARSLESINLPSNITEIRGSTFEICSSLKSITIPDSVTRIGGHAFYGCSSLSEVTLTENSKLEEIGSSAFRLCNSLYEIKIPSEVYVNERAFKESPTRVKKFGEIDYGNLIDSNKYPYDRYLYIHVNETQEINLYRKNAQLQNAYISLVSVTNDNNSSIFTLKYKDVNGEVIFNLSNTSPYKIINDKIAVELGNEYTLKYTDKISINTYFN